MKHMSCSQKSAIVSVVTALIVAAAFFAVYAVTQADVLACEHDYGKESSIEEDEPESGSLIEERKKRYRRGYIGRNLR